MELELVDLYAQFGLERSRHAAGRLRLYRPDDAVAAPRRPCALIVPGGGYEHLSARESEPVALRFAAKGWVAAVLEYAVRPARFPVPLREGAMAMAYLRRHAKTLSLDPKQIAAVGFSAGGHLAGMLGLLFDAPEVQDIAPWRDIRPDALGLCYPVAVAWGRTHEGSFANLSGGDRALRERLSLDRLARPDAPPTYLWCTRDDGSVPCRNTLLLAGALEEAGVELALHLYRHGPHGLATADSNAYPPGALPEMSGGVDGWLDEMLTFFAEVGLKRQGKAGGLFRRR